MTDEDAAKKEAEQLIAAYKARRRDQPAEPPATLSQPIPAADIAGGGASDLGGGENSDGADTVANGGSDAIDGGPGDPTA